MPVGTPKGRAPRFEDADVVAVGTALVSAVRRAQTKVPDLCKVRCVDALLCSFPPLRHRPVGGSIFTGVKIGLRLPSRQPAGCLGAAPRPSGLGAAHRDTAIAYPH